MLTAGWEHISETDNLESKGGLRTGAKKEAASGRNHPGNAEESSLPTPEHVTSDVTADDILKVKIGLPGVETMANVNVDVSSKTLKVEVPGLYLLNYPLSRAVDRKSVS